MGGIIENESIATNCQAKMLLHPGLKFHNTIEAAVVNLDEIGQKDESNQDAVKQEEQKENDKESDQEQNEEANQALDKLNEGRKIYKISNSMQDCGNVFEGSQIFFEYVINKEKKSEFKALKVLPFQVQIEYHKKDGSKMLRVISQTSKITLDRNKVRSNLNFDVMAKYGQHVTTELCAKGDYESSRAWTSANTNNNQQMFTLANYAQQNVALDHQMQCQMQSEQMDEIQNISMAPQPLNAFRSASSVQNGSNGMFGSFTMEKKKKGKKKKMKARKGARNDQFSSAMYSMKSKARKSHK